MKMNNHLTRSPVLNLSKPRDKRPLTIIDRDGLVAAWQQQAFAALDEMELRQREGTLTPRDAKDLAIKGGICTEKALLAAGQPTEVIGHVHAYRHELGPLIQRLAKVLGPHVLGSGLMAPVTSLGQSVPKFVTSHPANDAL